MNKESLTLKKLELSTPFFGALRVPVGIAVSPKVFHYLCNSPESKSICEPDYLGVRIYNVVKQAEDYLEFYNLTALQDYLLSMEPKSLELEPKEDNQRNQSKQANP